MKIKEGPEIIVLQPDMEDTSVTSICKKVDKAIDDAVENEKYEAYINIELNTPDCVRQAVIDEFKARDYGIEITNHASSENFYYDTIHVQWGFGKYRNAKKVKNKSSETYHKGHRTDNGSRIVAVVYKDPKPCPFDCILEVGKVVYLEDGSTKGFASLEELKQHVNLEREISEEEFNYLRTIARLETEIFMNQYTEGFPRSSTASNYAHHLYADLEKIL